MPNIAKAMRSNPVFREHSTAEPGRGRLGLGRTLGAAGSAVMEAREQATEDNLPTWPLWNCMVYLNKADERKHQNAQNKTKTLS